MAWRTTRTRRKILIATQAATPVEHVALVEELVLVLGTFAPCSSHTLHAACVKYLVGTVRRTNNEGRRVRTIPPPDRGDLRHFFRTWRRKISEGTLSPKKAVKLGPRVVHRKLLAGVPALAEKWRVEGAVEARGLVVRLVPFSLP